jgi:hypothetical protein
VIISRGLPGIFVFRFGSDWAQISGGGILVWALGRPSAEPYVRIMCGRVRLSSDVSEIKLVFSIPPHRPTPNYPPSWNVAPTDSLAVVRYDAKAGERSLDLLR